MFDFSKVSTGLIFDLSKIFPILDILLELKLFLKFEMKNRNNVRIIFCLNDQPGIQILPNLRFYLVD